MLAEKTLTHTSENLDFFCNIQRTTSECDSFIQPLGLGSTKNRPFKTYLARSRELTVQEVMTSFMIMALINRVKSSS